MRWREIAVRRAVRHDGAGHPAGLLLWPEGERRLAATCGPLGLMPTLDVVAETIELPRGVVGLLKPLSVKLITVPALSWVKVMKESLSGLTDSNSMMAMSPGCRRLVPPVVEALAEGTGSEIL